MADRRIAIRLGTEGKAQVVADLDAIGVSGDAAFSRASKRAEKFAGDAEVAVKRAKDAAAKLEIFMPGLTPAKLDSYAGVRDRPGKDAGASAAIYEAAFRKQDQAAHALIAAIDPLYAAQARYDAEMARATTLFDAGSLSAERYAQAQRVITNALDDQKRAAEQRAAAVQRASAATLDQGAGNRIGVPKSAQDSAEVFEAALRRDEEAARRLIAAIDPLYAAQQRFDTELAHAKGLLDSGALSAERYAQVEKRLVSDLDSVTLAQKRAAGASSAHRAGMQGLSYQAQDTFTQLSMGANPLNVIAIQGAQAAGQMANMGGKIGSVATTLAGPWGLAITGGLLLLGAFIDYSRDAAAATKKEADALKENAENAEIASRAKAAFAKTEVAARSDVLKLTEELDRQNDALRTNAERLNIRAKSDLATLRDAQAGSQGRLSKLNENQTKGNYNERLALQAEIADRQAAITRAEVAVQRTRVDLAVEAAKRMSDPMLRINRLYDEQARTAQAAADRAAKGHNVVTTALTTQLGAIEVSRKAALKAESDKQQASQQTARQYGREVSSSQAASIARAAGLQVNSVNRSTKRQQQLYDSWVADGKPLANPVAKPGTSAHERGNALDIQYAAGVSAKSIRDAFAAEGVRLTKVFAETGHWHVEWARTAEQRTAEKDAAKGARDLAAANRELDADLAGIVQRFLPARAAAEAYAEALASIALQEQRGKLSGGDAAVARLNVGAAENARRASEQNQRFSTLFGTDDPIATMREEQEVIRHARLDQEEEVRRKSEDGVRSVAGLYRDLMSGGVGSIWDRFKQQGQDAIAMLAAKWTIGMLTNSSSKLLSGVGTLLGGVKAPAKNAAGTEYFSGGASLVGENGPEVVAMPRGSRVTPAAETRRLLASNDNGGRRSFHFDLRGAVVTQDLLEQMNAIGAGAAVRGAAGGAALGEAESTARRARKLGRF